MINFEYIDPVILVSLNDHGLWYQSLKCNRGFKNVFLATYILTFKENLFKVEINSAASR